MKILAGSAALLLATIAFAADDETGFTALFNGKDTSGWHVRKPEAHNAWKVVDGILKNELKAGEHGVDLVTDTTFHAYPVSWRKSLEFRLQAVPNRVNAELRTELRHSTRSVCQPTG